MKCTKVPWFALLLVFFFAPLVQVDLFAGENVAKVIIMRGTVKAKLSDGSVIDVKVDQSIPEGAVVQTAEKSFVKLLFIDKSQMNLGPSSQMVINAFPKKEAGIITLVKGQIRSQVTKDYMEMDDKSKSKLYIKTKTAAMGIRGTDFQVNFNQENQNTVLITFEGKVAMSNIEKQASALANDQRNLEQIVSSDRAVMVTQGQISAVNMNVSERAMTPTKLGTKQIEALEKNETGLTEGANAKNGESKQFRNPIPPGVDGTSFSNNASEISKDISNLKTETSTNMPQEASAAIKTPKAEGFFDNGTGEYQLPAGSIVDLNTLNVIPPPTNAIFDANSKTYLVPESLGKIDKVTGEYIAPVGLKLESNGQFTVVDQKAYQKSQTIAPASTLEKTESTRAPAGEAPTNMVAPPPPKNIFEGQPEFKDFKDINAPLSKSAPPPVPRDALIKLATETQQKTEQAITDAANTTAPKVSTKVKFILNAQ